MEDLQEAVRLFLDGLLFLEVTADAEDGLQDAVLDMVVEGNLDVLEDRELRKQADVLECARDAALRDLVRLEADDALALKRDRARRRLIDARQHVEGRRLAGAVRADEADEFPAVQMDVEIRDGLEAAEYLRDILGA